MSPVSMALFVVMVPALVAAVTLAATGLVFRRAGMEGGARASVALALGAGALAAHLANAPPAFPPIEVTDRLPLLVLASTLLGLCESLRPGPAWTRWENRLLLTLLTLGLVMSPLIGEDWPTRADLAGQGGVVLVVLAVWANLEALAERRTTATLAPALIVVIASAGVALLLARSMVLCQLALGLASALGAVWVLSGRWPDRSLGRGGVPVLVAMTAALLIEGQVYASLPIASALLLASAPMAAWAGFVGPLRRLSPWQSVLVGAVAALVPAGLALYLAVGESPSWE